MSLSLIAQIVFWVSVGAMVHTYVCYPLTLKLFRRRFRNPPQMAEGEWPTVAILIPAYNEESVIGEKVRNSLALEYDADKVEVLVGSDGSTDRTNEIVREIGDSRLRLIELEGRNGKAGVLNHLVGETDAEILVFTDANVQIDPPALRRLIRHFADPNVGTVGGGKYIRIPKGAEEVTGEATYADMVNRLKELESQVGGTSGALGSLMAMRRELYQPYRPGSTNDDTVPTILAALAGRRNVWDSSARAFEESGHDVGDEFRRRIRIGAGNFQTLFRYPGILNPRCGIAAYTFFSHKIIRWVFPFLMIAALLSNLVLLEYPLYQLALAGQAALYGTALLGGLLLLTGLRLPLITGLYHFVALNAGLLLGFFVYLRGIRSSAWDRTERESAP